MFTNEFFRFLRRFYKGNPAAIIGSIIVATMIFMSVFASSIAENDPNKRVARGHQSPSTELLLGSTRSGKDIQSGATWRQNFTARRFLCSNDHYCDCSSSWN